MKRLFLLLGLLLAIAAPNFAQTKTDTLYFEFNIDKGTDSSVFVYQFSNNVISGIEVEYNNGKTQGSFNPGEGQQNMTVYGKGYWRIYYTYEKSIEYTVSIQSCGLPPYYRDIDVWAKGIDIDSLDIRSCTALASLNCSCNQLTTLDVSNNTALTSLSCEYNPLTTLDVSNNTALTSLFCYFNQLTSLDVSHNIALEYLECTDNQLTTLDVSNNTELYSLRCGNNPLKSLDISNNTALVELFCYNNQLKSLDVSNNAKLMDLLCSDNQLTTLDISLNTNLEELMCAKNQLTSLDVSLNTALTSLDCFGNRLTTLDLSHNTDLQKLMCYKNQLTTLDLSHNTDLEWLECNNNHIPLTMLYKAYIQTDWFQFQADQADTIIIHGNLPLDLSSERILGETVSTFEISDAPSLDSWTEKDFVFRFHKNGLYKLTLRNSSIRNNYEVFSGDNMDVTNNNTVTFTWYISVIENDDVTNESRDTDNFRVYVQDRTIYLSENQGLVQVYNMAGQCVYNGTATAIPVRQSGVYIVRVGARSHKVLVR